MLAIDCWITGCTWTEMPADGLAATQDARDAARIAHMLEQHSTQEMGDEREIRAQELDTAQLTQEQREDRNAIMIILSATILAITSHVDPSWR